jgi:hypothetical protein
MPILLPEDAVSRGVGSAVAVARSGASIDVRQGV